MAIGNCPRCGGGVDDENEYCDDCVAQDKADLRVEESAVRNRPFKVGDRVEVHAPLDAGDKPLWRCEGEKVWQLGRIIASGKLNNLAIWRIHLDSHTNPLSAVACYQQDSAQYMRHADAPLPDRGMPLSDRQKRSGRFEASHVCECGHSRYQHNHNGSGECMAKVWIEGQLDSSRCDCRKFSDRSFAGDPDPVNQIMPPTPEHLVPIIDTMKGFKVGDLLERTEGGVLNQYEIQSIAGEMVTYQRIVPNTEQTATVPVAWLAAKIMRGEVIYKPLDTRTKGNQLPQPVTPYEFKVGDILYKRVSSGDWYLLKVAFCYADRMSIKEMYSGNITTVSYDWVRLQFKRGGWRLPTTDEQLAYLNIEADRLDTLMAELYDQRAAVVERLNALKATQG